MQRRKTFIILLLVVFALFCRASIAQTTRTLSLDLVDKSVPFGLTQKIPAGLPKIGLALSGGGARSFSQLGIVRALEERNIPIDIITGTSMGSIIGGLYAAGYSVGDLDSIINNASWDAFFSIEESDRNELFVDKKITEDRALIAFRIDGLKPVIPTAVNTGQRVSNFLNLLAVNAPIHIKSDFDELLYSFRAICTNLVTGDEVILGKGLISQAMRASSSVSLLLEPVKIDTVLLADGGLVANVPVTAAKKSGADFIIAVNTTSPLRNKKELEYPWNIADQLVSIPMRKLNQDQLKFADIVIEPKLGQHGNTDFSKNDYIIQQGYKQALPFIDSIDKKVKEIYGRALFKENFYIKNLSLSDNPQKIEKKIIEKFAKADSVYSRDLGYELFSLYNSGNYKNVVFNLVEDSVKTILKIDLVENPIVKKVLLNGVIIIDFEKASRCFDPLINRPYSVKSTLKSLLAILRLYRGEGYSLAEIESVYFNELTQTLEVNISEGIISKIVVNGNVKTEDELITREFPIQAGEYFKYQNLETGLINLRSANLFENIELLLIKDFDENILEVNVNEKVTSLIRLGIRIDNENFTQVLVDIRDENLFGTGTELGVMMAGGVRNQSFAIEHRAYRIFNTYFTYSLQGFYRRQDINVYYDDVTAGRTELIRNKVFQYTQSFAGASFGLGTQIGKFGNVILEGKFQHCYVGDIPGQTQPLESIDVFSSRLALTLDSQNKYPYPNKGQYLYTYYETAQTILSGDLGFSKFYFDYKRFFNLSANNTLSARLKVGVSDLTLPLCEFFSIGGQNSFFGLREHEYRDRQLLIASLEYQFMFPFKLFVDTYFRIRYDLGSTWAVPEQIRYKDLRHGIGATLSFDTPVGPADFSVGKNFTFIENYPNNTIAWGETFFYFTIGYYY